MRFDNVRIEVYIVSTTTMERTALFVFAVAVIVCGVVLYFTSLGLSAFGGFIGRLLG